MKLEILYFDKCPSWQQTQSQLIGLLGELGIEEEILLKRVETQEEALENQFSGSPTIRVDGVDIFPVDHEDYALGCRLYATPQGMKGSPTREMMRKRLVDLIKNN